MARSVRSLTRLLHGLVLRHQAPLPHAAPPASSTPLLQGKASSFRFMSDDHTAKWMQEWTCIVAGRGCPNFIPYWPQRVTETANGSTDKKSPMQLIDEVAPIKVDARVVACEGGTDPALGHPIEYISLDGAAPAVCKYCGLRYYQGDAHGHH